MVEILAPVARQLFLKPSDGTPAAGYKVFTFAAGSTTKLATYTDSTGGTPNANPIILDSLGECDIWIPASIAYKFVFSPPTDTDPPTNAIWTRDNIQFPATSAVATLAINGASLAGGAVLGVNGPANFSGAISNNLGGFTDSSTTGFIQNSAGVQATFLASGITLSSINPVTFSVIPRTGGVILADGATSWAAISLRAKKKNLEPILGALDIVSKLEAGTGHYLEDADDSKRRPFLFYEDFEKYWPYPTQYMPARQYIDEATGETIVTEEIKALSKEEVVPLLVAAIQELVLDRDAMRVEIASLRALVTPLA